ncbi:hypothetical protein JKG68_07650 [Microvirga aerilata]|uniref:Uncharacterized protein n=1 Tax=Microvirga aerilata TaxID=670292 RepID=A0A936Z670_9HYPH|nr:hypothetical protein [Microvirga aerilata]MBL0403833.1 hypothetical protein [Microvirga aerilata]
MATPLDEISPQYLTEVRERERGTWREKLRKRYPNWTKQLQWGFEHGDGWRTITERVFADLATIVGTDNPEMEVHQIKAKVGTYNFYIDASHLPAVQRAAIEARLTEANSEAGATCETCGRPGQLIRDRGWYHVACPAHEVRDIQ